MAQFLPASYTVQVELSAIGEASNRPIPGSACTGYCMTVYISSCFKAHLILCDFNFAGILSRLFRLTFEIIPITSH